VTAVRNLLDRWRTVTRGTAASCEVLARGDVAFHVEGLAAQPLTLARCAEQLADAITADALDAHCGPLLPPPSDDALTIVDAYKDMIAGLSRAPSPDWAACLAAHECIGDAIREIVKRDGLVIASDVDPVGAVRS
jgi:hypothetical protein